MVTVPVIPESAPFNAAQRAWLNGFLAGVLGLDQASHTGGLPAAPDPGQDSAEDFPWHDPALALDERMTLAQDRPLARKMMAAMGQLDCGQCGHLCQTYAERLADGAEQDPGKCVPGGKPTTRKLKELLAARASAGTAPVGRATTVVPQSAASCGTARDRPWPATLLASQPLNQPGAEKQTQNVVLSLAGSELTYAPGDSLGVWADNYPEEVDLILTILRARGSEQVTLADGSAATAREALTRHCNLREPGDELYALLSRHAKEHAHAAQLERIAQDDDAAMEHGVHDVFDALVRFRSARPTVAEFVAALGRLQPRLYSIASSLRRHPAEVHLTVAVVRYALHRRDYGGVASTFFAERLRPGQRVRVYVQPSHGFRLPANPMAPIIMVGPGTGVAPFRAFLQERAATGAAGRNWLIFGNQRRDLDFLYRDELEDHLRTGVLTTLTTAFSRDQQQKVYVQHRLLEYGAELWRWLAAGAYFYVCGDAQRMARDVNDALSRICVEQGGMSAQQAAAHLASLSAAGRYQRDVY